MSIQEQEEKAEPPEQEPKEQSKTTRGYLNALNITIVVIFLIFVITSFLFRNMTATEQFNGWLLVLALISATCSCFSQAYDVFRGEKRSVPGVVAYVGVWIALAAAALKAITLL